MTPERRHQLLETMVAYLSDVIEQDEDLFQTLNGKVGMTKEEFHEFGIDYLDGFFHAVSDQERLLAKTERRYAASNRTWKRIAPEYILDNIEELYAIHVANRILMSRSLPDDLVIWLVRFRNPLALVSDTWLAANDSRDQFFVERFIAILREYQDRGNAEEDYMLDDEAVSESS